MIDIKRRGRTPQVLLDAASDEATWDALDKLPVLKALHSTFDGKCYLCEKKYELPTYEIDHRVPKNECPQSTFCWFNLFPICESCNKRRRKTWPRGGMLSPGCGQDLEVRLVHTLDFDNARGVVPRFAAKPSDTEATNTADELTRIHDNSTDDQGERPAIKGEDIRSAIHRQLTSAQSVALQFMQLRRTAPDSAAFVLARDKLSAYLSRKSSYTALLRSRFERYPEIVALFD